MKITDVTCPDCGAGFCRLELGDRRGTTGDYLCPACDAVVEELDGQRFVAYRLTMHPLAHVSRAVAA